MGSKKTKRTGRKRTFHGNQYRKVETPQKKIKIEQETPVTRASGQQGASARKIRFSSVDLSTDDDDYYIFLSFKVLHTLISILARCKDCNGDLSLYHNEEKRMGFSTFLTVKCQQCEWKHEFYSSSEIEMKNSPGRNMQDVNLRAVLAFREIGRGHEAMKMFASCMNMPLPMAYKSYAAINDLLLDAYKESANESMVMAGKDVRTNIVGSDFQNTRVSVDGTWQKRGFSSMNGVVVAISDEGKVLDHQVMSKLCKSCSTWAKRKGTPEYEEWHTHHSCSMNHSKSSGAMEAEGAVEIFRRSETKHKLRYVEYIGDGDTGSFAKVVQSRPYGDSILPQKLECIGHVQKRVGTRLRNLRKEYKNKVLSDGKKLSGQGRLTDKCINTLQNFYGLAIRQNQGNLANMKRAIGAILYHCSNIPDKEIRHQFCPKTKDSWCKWQLDKLNNTSHHKDRINKGKHRTPMKRSMHVFGKGAQRKYMWEEMLLKLL